MAGYLKVKLKNSGAGREKSQKLTLKALGLRRFGQERIHPDTPSLRGMLNKIPHLVIFEKTQSDKIDKPEREVTYRLLS